MFQKIGDSKIECPGGIAQPLAGGFARFGQRLVIHNHSAVPSIRLGCRHSTTGPANGDENHLVDHAATNVSTIASRLHPLVGGLLIKGRNSVCRWGLWASFGGKLLCFQAYDRKTSDKPTRENAICPAQPPICSPINGAWNDSRLIKRTIQSHS